MTSPSCASPPCGRAATRTVEARPVCGGQDCRVWALLRPEYERLGRKYGFAPAPTIYTGEWVELRLKGAAGD